MRTARRNEALALACALCGLLAAGPAAAETYTVLAGALVDGETGERTRLRGSLEARILFPAPAIPRPATLVFDDFALEAGDETLLPRGTIEYMGYTPIPLVSIADQAHVEGEFVSFLRLHAGAELIEATDSQATFRTLELRADANDGGRAAGLLGDFPRRLELQGRLVRVDQTFRVPESCEPPVFPLPPPPGGGGVVIGGATVISHASFDIADGETVTFTPPEGGPGPGRLTDGGVSSIDGTLGTGGSVVVVSPPLLELASATRAAPVPSLDELGITAPDGAVVSYEDGALTITSEGDLFIEGGAWDLPGLVSVSISTATSITVTGAIALPPEVTLSLEAGTSVIVDDDGGIVQEPPPGDVVLDPIPLPCGLRHVGSVGTEVGSFSLVATAAQPAEVEVEPWRRHDRVDPGSRRPLPVALLGSEDLDVRDLDRTSLRLGPGEAPPLFRWLLRLDVDRDRRLDLLGFFRPRDAGIAYGDDLVCLVAETRDGGVVEGCDRIDTTPRRPHGPWRWRR